MPNMAKYRYTLYDTIVFGTSAQNDQALFQVPQGGDTTHTKSFTNMRGAGALPAQEKFDIDKVGVYCDFNNLVPADLINMWIGNYLEIRVADNSALFIPLRAAAQYNAYAGHYSQGTAANGTMGGLVGDGYVLDYPIHVEGGVAMRVNVPQITALSVASVPVRILLHGILDRP